MTWRGVVAEFHEYLPLDPGIKPVTLLEGNTPLIDATRLAERLGFEGRLLLKCEGLNPTGSFKDRGMSVAISAAVSQGADTVICASTGNTSASAAAYAAKAGIRAFVVVPEGKIAIGKLAQALAHGAVVAAIDGSFDQALTIVSEIADSGRAVLVNSINPYRIQGQKTAAFEVCSALGGVPDYHFLPVGNAGNITAYWLGYGEFHDAGEIDGRPKMMGFQAEGAAPIVRGRVITEPETVATAIRIGNPANWKGAIAARDESGGVIAAVTDAEILQCYRLVGTTEGIFCEPASAASLAGLKAIVEAGKIESSATVVCTLTGHGLKDPETAHNQAPAPLRVGAEVGEVSRVFDL
jgi:threonine synthase